MHRIRGYIAVALLLLLVGISTKVLAQDQKMPSQEERAKAVNVVRLINTAELWYNMGTKTETDAIEAHGRYASWDELNNSGVLRTVQSRPFFATVKDLQVSANPEVMPGYRLDLLVSADGKSYSLALHDTKNGDGLFSVFSDQKGIIFLGSALQ
ncbi:MAG: hypothetical protein WBE21_01255 [Candidatus Acidiferrales bacterium]